MLTLLEISSKYNFNLLSLIVLFYKSETFISQKKKSETFFFIFIYFRPKKTTFLFLFIFVKKKVFAETYIS
jgi:hypothetical protein